MVVPWSVSWYVPGVAVVAETTTVVVEPDVVATAGVAVRP